jgi:hypothetical protein
MIAAADEYVTFVPGDPPRAGRFACWRSPAGSTTGTADGLRVVVPSGRGTRAVDVPARYTPVADVIDPLLALPVDVDHATLAPWADVVTFAVDLVARGRFHPGITTSGLDTWRAGPLTPADERYVTALASALPAAAHALPSAPDPGRRAITMQSPDVLVRDAVDAVIDAFVRAPAASVLCPGAYTSTEPHDVMPLDSWLTDLTAAPDTQVRPALRLELPDGPDGSFVAVVQLTSAADPSLTVDAADVWSAPAAVAARFGDRADTDLLLALRRGGRAWPPLTRLLEEARPSALALRDTDVMDLLGDAGARLGASGVDVLVPAELATHPQLRAVIGTPQPAAVTAAGFTLASLLEFRWVVSVGGHDLTAEELAVLAEAKRPLVRVRGRWVMVDADLVAKLRRAPKVHGGDALGAAISGSIEVDGEVVTATVVGAVASLADGLAALEQETDAPEPAGLAATLRPYQRRGVAWMAALAQLGLGGCLADDMGLGKTVQVIALHLRRHEQETTVDRRPTLVICPASLLANWEREIGRFAPGLPVRRFHGGDRTVSDVAADEFVLTTYGVVRRDHGVLANQEWGLLVADEAQHAKNPLSRTARSLRALPVTGRIALTGTPVENRLSDLWSILDWASPGLLGPLESFRRRIAIPVERDRDPAAVDAFARVIRPFVLRRRKTDPSVAPDLPPKTETDRLVPLTAEQATLYEAVVRETMAEITAADGIGRRGLVLKLLTALKQVCNHPAQYLGQPAPIAGRSGKLDALDELLDVILDEGDSVLVFTQYVVMARLLERHLGDRGVATRFLHGSVPVVKRQAIVDAFQAGDAPVLLLSLKAGGTGLNLTRATHVVHYDRWWNPAVEDQASDRAWRIGQDRPVQVHRLVTEGTVEDRIGAVLAAKRGLADAVAGGGEAWIAELSDEELVALVELGQPR